MPPPQRDKLLGGKDIEAITPKVNLIRQKNNLTSPGKQLKELMYDY